MALEEATSYGNQALVAFEQQGAVKGCSKDF